MERNATQLINAIISIISIIKPTHTDANTHTHSHIHVYMYVSQNKAKCDSILKD